MEGKKKLIQRIMKKALVNASVSILKQEINPCILMFPVSKLPRSIGNAGYVVHTVKYSTSKIQNVTLRDSLQNIFTKFDATINEKPLPVMASNLATERDIIKSLTIFAQNTNLNVGTSVQFLQDSSNKLTSKDFSIFINRLFDEKDYITTAITDIDVNSFWKRLYHIYRVFVVNKSNRTLDAMILYDLNKFAKLFIKLNDLPTARAVFQLILKNSKDGEIPKDADTINLYLKLYCGGITKFWLKPTNRDNFHDFSSGTSKKETWQVSSYPAVSKTQFLAFLRKVLEDPEYSKLRNCEMESLLVHSLGYYKDLHFLNRFLEVIYGVSNNGTINKDITASKKLYPNYQLLSSIITSYSYNDQISTGITTLAGFMKKYPDINLEKLFWRRLAQWSCKSWDRKLDRSASVPKKCWQIMIQWHASKNKNIPFDQKMMLERLLFLQRRGDYISAMNDIKNTFKSVYLKAPRDVFILERLVLFKYQKFIIKKLVNKSQTKKAIDFINEWQIDYENGLFLQDYYQLMVQIKEKNDAASKSSKRVDDEDDDFNFPLFGTNIL